MSRCGSSRELCTITSYETHKIVCRYEPRVRVKVDLATVKDATNPTYGTMYGYDDRYGHDDSLSHEARIAIGTFLFTKCRFYSFFKKLGD